MTHRTVLSFFSATVLATLVLACGKDTPTASDGPFLQVSPLFSGVDSGSMLQMSASLSDAVVPVTWESSNPAVATVSSTGLVTGVAVGIAAATATLADGSQKRSASITVVAPTGTALTNGVAVTGLGSATSGTTKLFRLNVPPGTTSLSVVLTGGTGDADIFVRRQTPPTATSFTCSSETPDTTEETCTISNPPTGDYYILVKSFIYSGASLTATTTP
ncbi:MAG TPA: pre-peptidase C-terminal domain-containing protein [Gemmatimonadaceae bacterium]|nr:pre-peptidase C-terminal domain-containing protein [Gemmatimonadaceae bacterium]